MGDEFDGPVEDDLRPAPGLRERIRARLRRAGIRFLAVALFMIGVGAVVWAVTRSGDDRASETQPPSATFIATPADWPPDVPATVHTIPAMIKNELAYTNQQQGYQFNGTQNQVWQITVESDSTLDPMFRLYAPSGAVVLEEDDRSADDLTAEGQITLPETGPYRLLVQSSQGGLTTGAYLLSVWQE